MSSLIVEVVRLNEFERHPNADTLLIATVKGWRCIVKEGQFSAGDLAVYVPIDSILPPSLIEKHGITYLKDGRVRAVKLRQVLSEGLLLTLPEGVKWREGRRVAGELGITKWEPPVPKTHEPGKSSSPMRPNRYFRRYCDPENVKNFPDVFKPGDMVRITEKIHGSNYRVGWVKRDPVPRLHRLLPAWLKRVLKIDEWEFCVGSRNVHLQGEYRNRVFDAMKGNPYWAIARKYDLKNRIPTGAIMFGEIYGPGIQDLTYGQKEIDVRFFDAMLTGQYGSKDDFDTLLYMTGLPGVPVLYEGPYEPGMEQRLYSQESLLCPGHIMEGCVITSLEEEVASVGRKILKAINPEYLLRKNGTERH